MPMPVQPTAQSQPSGVGNDVNDILASAGQITAYMEATSEKNKRDQEAKQAQEAQKAQQIALQQQYISALPANAQTNASQPSGTSPTSSPSVMPRSASMPVSTVEDVKAIVSQASAEANQRISQPPAQAVTIPANAVAMNSGTPAMLPSFNFSPADLKGGSRVGGVTFIDPLGGKGTLTSPFGERNHPVHGGKKMHKGQDLAAAQGTPILSVAEGTVTVNASDPLGYGNWIEIKHKNGQSTRYGHMKDKSPLAVGAEVKQGQVIGAVGSTGSSTGPHLHFEVRDTQGQAEDPIAYLPGQSKKA